MPVALMDSGSPRPARSRGEGLGMRGETGVDTHEQEIPMNNGWAKRIFARSCNGILGRRRLD
ncbi:hypothetical protein Poly41_07440 [Novipirellula artificiosorum]|uniref:Uncharacterized protein n=1 Tax=Novipirellula artificiosorum TaxID=2528016 RepID=A0A5C6E3A0_9BACT|nr:hypothetical protein Poly41_07440 [Novipirellula artificiosorum]